MYYGCEQNHNTNESVYTNVLQTIGGKERFHQALV